MGKRRELWKCKRDSSRLWRKNKCRSQKTREVGDSRRVRPQKRETTREIYSKDVV